MRLVVALAVAFAGAACGLPETGPIALDDRFEAAPGQTLTLDVLANDRPPAGEQFVLGDVTGGRGAVEVDGATLRYRAPDDEGVDSFSYEVTVDGETYARAEVVVTVGAAATTTTSDVTTSDVTTSEVSTSSVPGRPPSVDPASLDFGVVGAGAIARRSVTVVAGDEPWTPDWSGVGSGDAAELEVVGTCAGLAPHEACTVEVVWNATQPLETTLQLRDDLPYQVHGRVSPLEVVPAQQTTRVSADEADTQVGFAIVAPSGDPVAVTVAVVRGPEGTEIVEGCEVVQGSCGVVVLVPVDAPGERPPVVVEVATPTDRLEARIDVVVVPGGPEWIVPTDGDELWFELPARGMTVRHAPVDGADEVLVAAFLCADDDCAVELVTDRIPGSPTDVNVVAPAGFDVGAWYQTVVAGGAEPRLRLDAVARVGEELSSPSVLAVRLVDEPMVASWQSYDPPDPPGGCVELSAVIAVDSHLLEPVTVVARFAGDEPESQVELSDPVAVPPGSSRLEATILLEFPLETITLVPPPDDVADFPGVPVVGAPGYTAVSCIE